MPTPKELQDETAKKAAEQLAANNAANNAGVNVRQTAAPAPSGPEGKEGEDKKNAATHKKSSPAPTLPKKTDEPKEKPGNDATTILNDMAAKDGPAAIAAKNLANKGLAKFGTNTDKLKKDIRKAKKDLKQKIIDKVTGNAQPKTPPQGQAPVSPAQQQGQRQPPVTPVQQQGKKPPEPPKPVTPVQTAKKEKTTTSNSRKSAGIKANKKTPRASTPVEKTKQRVGKTTRAPKAVTSVPVTPVQQQGQGQSPVTPPAQPIPAKPTPQELSKAVDAAQQRFDAAQQKAGQARQSAQAAFKVGKELKDADKGGLTNSHERKIDKKSGYQAAKSEYDGALQEVMESEKALKEAKEAQKASAAPEPSDSARPMPNNMLPAKDTKDPKQEQKAGQNAAMKGQQQILDKKEEKEQQQNRTPVEPGQQLPSGMGKGL